MHKGFLEWNQAITNKQPSCVMFKHSVKGFKFRPNDQEQYTFKSRLTTWGTIYLLATWDGPENCWIRI